MYTLDSFHIFFLLFFYYFFIIIKIMHATYMIPNYNFLTINKDVQSKLYNLHHSRVFFFSLHSTVGIDTFIIMKDK